MTPRERWEAVLKRDKPDRIPMDYWATSEATEKLLKHLGCGTLEEALSKMHVDRPITVSPVYTGPEIPNGSDVFGCKHQIMNYASGSYVECVYHPLASYDSVEQIETEYTWPDNDWWDYSTITDQIKGKEDQSVRGGGSEPFLTYCHLRGQQQAYMDMALNPDIVHYCLDKLFDLAYTKTQRIFEQIPGKVMITYIAEDLGSQESLLFSPENIHEFFLPRMKRMMDLTHQNDSYVFTHSDGSIREIIPDLIEIGMDVLNPIQWRCKGMDREELKKTFGEQIVFHGAMDNQQTLAFESEEIVRQEVRDNIRILAAGGGYILAPCHNIQAVSPPENIVAMYETGYNEGWV